MISTNRKARQHFKILETLEAGLELRGTEVKSIRAGKVNLTSAFARIDRGEMWLHQMDVASYEPASFYDHEPRRVRKLLLHREEIRRLNQAIEQKGRSVVALDLHWKGARVKVLLGVAEGKTHEDRREDIKSADAKREIQRAMKQRARE